MDHKEVGCEVVN